MLRYKKKIIGCILILFFYLSSNLFSTNVFAASTKKVIYNENGCQIEFVLNSQWEKGMEAQLIITNQTEDPIKNWRIQLNFIHEIATIWDAEIESQKEGSYLIKFPSWQPNIPANGKVVVGFTANKNGELQIPSGFLVKSKDTEVKEEDYTIEYKVTSDWKDAFNAEISIKNNTQKKIEGWKLEFDFSSSIRQIWNAKLKKQEQNHYFLENDEWNSIIQPGQTIRIGFEAFPGGSNTKPENFVFTKKTLEEEAETEDIEKYIKDTDNDGIPDRIEEALGLDPNNADIDGDGLPDGYEWDFTNTHPEIMDTDKNSITDDQEDFDQDGLTNLEEWKLQTDPLDEDTDHDGIPDGKEVEETKTDPLEEDTDQDGIKDGHELLLGLDPLKKETHKGTPDGKFQIEQTILEEDCYINKFKNKYKFSMDILASGYVPSQFAGNESRFQNVFSSNRAILGKAIDLGYIDGEVSSVTLKFRIQDKYVASTIQEETAIRKEFSGLKRYNIFKFFPDENLLLPVSTTIEESTNTLIAKVDELGTYCVMDMEKWLYDLGYGSEIEVPYTVRSLQNQISDLLEQNPAKEGKYINKQADITFVVDASKSMVITMEKIKAYLDVLVLNLYNKGITLHVSVVEYTDYLSQGKKATKVLKDQNNDIWASTKTSLRSLINKLQQRKGKIETPIDALEKARRLDFRKNATKFVVLLTDENYDTANRYGIKSLEEMASKLAKDQIITSVVTVEKLEEAYAVLSNKTNGKLFDLNTNFNVALEEFILSKLRKETGYTYISSLTLAPFTLQAPLEKDGKTDTDLDGLTDSQEVNWEYVKSEENPEFYTLKELMESSDKPYVRSAFKRFQLSRTNPSMDSGIGATPEVVLDSDPDKKDSDGDKIPDKNDIRPHTYDIKSAKIHESLRPKGLTDKGEVADDMKCGDYTKEQLRSAIIICDPLFSLSTDQLFHDFESGANLFAIGELESVVHDVIQHFKNGNGADYSNPILAKNVREHSSSKEFLEFVKTNLIAELKKNKGDLNRLRYSKDKKTSFSEFLLKADKRPVFNQILDYAWGLKILVNDTWGHHIFVDNYTVTKEGFQGNLRVIVYDHFGLDRNDIEKFTGRGVFDNWFFLQRYDQFQKKFKPFATIMQMEVPFEGVF